MKKFSLDKTITSCFITKNLIEQLEHYLFNTLPQIVDIPRRKILEKYSLTVSDEFGAERLSSISDYHISKFPDKTDEITIELSIYSPKLLSIDIRFNKDKFFSDLRISFESDNPREVVTGIYESIKRIIKTQININKIFHLHASISGFLFSIGLASFISTIVTFIRKNINLGIISLFIFILILFYFVIGILKPYISFESNRYFIIKRFSDWFFWSFLTFIVFGIIFVLLRKKILGF